MKKTLLTFAVMAGIFSFAENAKAQNELFTSINNPSYFSVVVSVGYSFNVGANPISVTELGNNCGNGALGNFQVGIWDSIGNLVASSKLYCNGQYTPVGYYNWSLLGTPVTLAANSQYTIGSVGDYSAAQFPYYGTASGLSSDITINASYAGSGSGNFVNPQNSLPWGINGSGIVVTGANLKFNTLPYQVYSQSGTTTVSTPITGNVEVQQNGSGSTILTAQNSYSGGTVVSAGTLVANGPNSPTSSLGTGNITINSGGTLLVNGDNSMGYDSSRVVTINAGGTLTINGVNTEHLSQIVLNGVT